MRPALRLKRDQVDEAEPLIPAGIPHLREKLFPPAKESRGNNGR
jgi:hypothetical protein